MQEVRAGSEAHLIPDHQSMGMHKLPSLTAALDVFPRTQGSANISRLASVNSAVLARAASESVLKHCSSRSLAELGQLSGVEVGRLPCSIERNPCRSRGGEGGVGGGSLLPRISMFSTKIHSPVLHQIICSWQICCSGKWIRW